MQAGIGGHLPRAGHFTGSGTGNGISHWPGFCIRLDIAQHLTQLTGALVTGWAALVFVGILLAAYLYSRAHKAKLGEIQVKAETTLDSL